MLQCKRFNFSGSADLALTTKLRWLKYRIKRWLAVDHERKEGEYTKKKEEVRAIELAGENRSLIEIEMIYRSECLTFIKDVDNLKYRDIKQKSRVRWAKVGDENSKYFHRVLNSNLSSNRSHGLLIDGTWVLNPGAVKDVVFEFFRNRFEDPVQVRPTLSLPNFKRLSDVEAGSLISPFTVPEIKEVVWECDGDGAPGPDGYNFMFLKKFWDCFQEDFAKIFAEFFYACSCSRGCLASFIALIPKKKDPTSLNEVRPISFVGCVNKVISKVLVGRLKKVIGGLVSEEQLSFIANRSILDGPLIINEVLAWLNRSKKKGMIFKVDIEQSYDSLHWGFLDSVLEQMGFPLRWRRWVLALHRNIAANYSFSTLFTPVPKI